MSENSWQDNDSYDEPLAAFVAELPEELSDELDPQSFRGFQGRRRKAAAVLVVIWSGTIALHLITWGYWLAIGLATLMGVHAVRLLLARPADLPAPLVLDTDCPKVSLLVAAKNEEAVVGKLVKMLCNLDYPSDRYEVWVIDDASTDQTPELLDQLAMDFPQLNVLHRSANSPGGKSGALNDVLPLTTGEVLVVFDADAQVDPMFLRRVLPMFQQETVGAVQVRKAIVQAEDASSPDTNNFWVRGQMAEMALDAFIHQQRAAIGGLGELRGNGQLVRRKALLDCGGWNEETITDDLDLTFRLHLNRWSIEVVTEPAVYEEGVTSAVALWHQRNRWAEGGYQRYLDYWRLILKNRMGAGKTLDLFMFWMIQYVMPSAAIPDALMAIVRHRPMLTSPFSALTVLLFLFGTVSGLRRVRRKAALFSSKEIDLSPFVILFQSLRGALYMTHWLVIVGAAIVRMSIRPKQLKWVKTVHRGDGH
jgi:1,2-diacylglycerol 3-beta-glucosyltransferase